MKKYIYYIALITLITSCSDLDGVNVDKKRTGDGSAAPFVANATKELFDQMINTNVNENALRFFAQYWTETTYTDEANYNIRNRDIPGDQWMLYNDVIKNLNEAKQILEALDDPTIPEELIKNQISVTEILSVFTYHVLVDTFGYIPYSEAMDINNLTPAYDSDEEIYADLVTRLDEAISNIDTDYGTFSDGLDLVYNGDSQLWKKFGNSLKLRLALRYANTDDAKARKMAEEAVADGVFTSIEDQPSLVYLSAAPNTNKLWEDLVQSKRKDFVGANTVIDIMNELEDPRREVYFKPNLVDATETVYYKGGTFAAKGNSFNNSSQIGEVFHQPDLEGVLMNYAEIEFSLAEAVERGYNVGGSAEEHYNKGISASIDYWFTIAGTDPESVKDDYLTNPKVAYTTAEGTWQEKIATQKWLALYNSAFEGWSTYRRLGYPEMNISGVSKLPTPRRYTYPQEEPSSNGTNYNTAASAMGGDELSSRVFWDVE